MSRTPALSRDCCADAEEKEARSLRGRDGRLLLGVTGGIASGKSTVAGMLAERGAPVIDFDVLARQVVQPGKPAWREIVDYFGKRILQAGDEIDRKALSRIVFQDSDKRTLLEGFTHPRILAAFALQVEEIAARRPGVIIQAVVPLLIELNLQPLFHKILLVYVPRTVQIARLMARDAIPQTEAERMLDAQMPIDEKQAYADYTIRNDGSPAETRAQVEALWENLQELQARRREKKK